MFLKEKKCSNCLVERLTQGLWGSALDYFTLKCRVNSIASWRGRGAECPLTAKNCQKSGKRGKKRERLGKEGKIGKRRKTWEKKQKLGKFFHFAPPDREGWLRHCAECIKYSALAKQSFVSFEWERWHLLQAIFLRHSKIVDFQRATPLTKQFDIPSVSTQLFKNTFRSVVRREIQIMKYFRVYYASLYH